MVSRQVFLKDLKVADLKRELEERECETTGKKADLQNRLREALENEGENPNTYLFEIAGDINSALQSLENKLLENSGSLEKNLEEKLLENATQMQQKFEETSGNLRGMEQRLVENSSNLRGMEQNLRGMEQKLIENMDQKLLESYTTLEKKITENSSCLQKQIDEYVDGKFGEIENKFLEVERKIGTLSLGSGEQQQVVNTALKSPGSDIDRLSKPELNNYMEISKIRMKPQFDARANGWSLAEKATALTLALRGDATYILQTLSLEEQDDYHQLVKHLEMRYGQSHLEHVYHSQLKNRYQKSNESLQEFEADIARLVRLAYSSTPENVMERLAVQAFLDGLRDTETRQALTLARPSKLVDALARALEFEAAKQSCRSQAKVRKMEEDVEKGICNEAKIRRVVEEILDKRPIRCWNVAKRDELLRGQENDPNLKPIVDWKKEDRKPTWEEVSRYSPTIKSYWAQWNSLVLSDGLLKRVLKKSDGTEERKQLIVPRNRVPEVLEEIHNGSTGGHLKPFGQLEELRRQRPEVGRVLQIKVAQQEKERSLFYLVTKQLSYHKPTYQTVWDTLVELRDVLLSQSISSLAIPKIASGLDGLDWRVIRSMLEVLFRFTGIEIQVCCYNPRRSLNEKTVDCFFYQTSRCKNGSFCRYRHGPEDDTIRDEMSLRRGQCYELWASPPLPASMIQPTARRLRTRAAPASKDHGCFARLFGKSKLREATGRIRIDI
ncbi:hypothetical protein NQ318_007739 [Aromia moschata]|uniref:Uncharacterized protein n=1 Tax=Aromia moschata TaxID=1265417 RepID=A0AAV8YYR5_9CUCU|nr:hypothetical protein NQ318_007739 [Aromia moschata]